MIELTLKELKERLSDLDEITLIEILELNSAEIVKYLEDVIEEKQDELRYKLQDEEEEAE